MNIIHFLKKYSFVIGLILFLIILSKADLGEIFQNIKIIKPFYLVLALLMSLPMFIDKALCWRYIIKQQGIKYSLKDSFLMYCSGLYLGVVTPGRMGEIAKALYLKKDGYSMGKSLVGAVLDRLTDFIFLYSSRTNYRLLFSNSFNVFSCRYSGINLLVD